MTSRLDPDDFFNDPATTEIYTLSLHDALPILTFTLDSGAPAGASITPGGDFSWTPAEADGPGPVNVTVRVSDGAGVDDFETITIMVNEVNVPPVLNSIGSQSIDEGSPLTFTATATDPDLPANSLTFTLDSGAPAGASIK